MDYFWQNYLPNSILLSVGPFSIHYYGLILVIAMSLAAFYAVYSLVNRGILFQKKAEDLIFYLIIFGLIGARFGHVVFFNFNYYFDNPGDIIKVWQGGLSIQGALLFGLGTAIFWSIKNKINFLKLSDAIVPSIALGQAIGRWGNYFNQELYGQPASWGIPINPVNRVAAYEGYNFFQPAFFYESILNLLLFLVLHKLSKKDLKAGYLVAIYLFFYGFVRFFMEFIRIDETPEFFSLRLPQLISLVLVLSGILIALIPLPKADK